MAKEVQSFQEDVIEASRRAPVLVDFWAPWCGPCRTLAPVLEKLESEQAPSWTLVKVNTDQHQEVSARYRIQGIPAVKLFIDGEVVDEFTGALPEQALRQWLDQAIPSEKKALFSDAEQLLAAGNGKKAAELLESVLMEHPNDPAASGLLARVVAFSDPERALKLAQTAATGEPALVQIADAVRSLAALRNRAADADDWKSEPGGPAYEKALAALMDGDLEKAVESFIEVIKVNRFLDDDAARKACVAIFLLLGDTHPITRRFRRTFDMWLY